MSRSVSIGARAGLFWGLVVLAGGLMLAGALLPEWGVDEVPERQRFVERFDRLAGELGLAATSAEEPPKLRLTASLIEWRRPFRRLERSDARQVEAQGRPLLVIVTSPRRDSAGGTVTLRARFGLDGRPWEVGLDGASEGGDPDDPDGSLPDELFEALIDDGERLEPVPTEPGRSFRRRLAVVGSDPPQVVEGTRSMDGSLSVRRQPVTEPASPSSWRLLVVFAVLFGWLAVLVLVGTTAILWLNRGRVDLKNGVVLAGAGLLVGWLGNPGLFDGSSGSWLAVAGFALVVCFTWSLGESLARQGGPTADDDRSTGLDALCQGRVGRRVARGLTWGLAAGAALAGVRLASAAGSLVVPWLTQHQPTLYLPSLPQGVEVLLDLFGAALLLLLLALAERSVPTRLRMPAVWLASTLWLGLTPNSSLNVDSPWLLAAVTAALWIAVLERGGTLALVSALATAHLYPVVAFGLQVPSWRGRELGFALGGLGLVAAVALVGSGRRRGFEEVRPPAFLRLAREEQRLEVERELLAQMESDLTPAMPPDLTGWRLTGPDRAVDERGRLWGAFEHRNAVWLTLGSTVGEEPGPALVRATVGASVTALVDRDPTPEEMMAGIARGLEGLGGQGGGAWPELAFTVVRLGRPDGAVSWARTAGPSPRPLGRPGAPGQAVAFVTDRSLTARGGGGAGAATAEPPHLVLLARHQGGVLRG